MATLAAIQKQIAELERQAEAIRKSEAKAAADKVRQLIAQHGLRIEDIGLVGRAAKKAAGKVVGAGRKPAAAKPAGIAKYRDPKSGKTWTGTGKPPGWIASAKNRDKFLITATAPATSKTVNKAPAAQKPVASPAKKTAAPQPAARKRAANAARPAAPGATDAVPAKPAETPAA